MALFRPDDFTPERFGYQQGVPPLPPRADPHLHAEAGDRGAAQQFYDFFVANQNLDRHSRWDNGWPTHDRYLSRARVRAHLRGKDIYGCWGDEWMNWFGLDLDYHGGDPALFLSVLGILTELPDCFRRCGGFTFSTEPESAGCTWSLSWPPPGCWRTCAGTWESGWSTWRTRSSTGS